MKKVVFFFFFTFLGFLAGIGLFRFNLTKGDHYALIAPQFVPTEYTMQNRPFVIIVVGHNNGAVVDKTLSSIFSQNYENFRMIYVDDASDDGSFELARDLIYDMKYLIPTTLMQNERPLGILESLNGAIQTCSDDEIVIVMNGSGWLAHEWTLKRLNQYYANKDLWITHGPFRSFPTFELGDVFSKQKYSSLSFHSQTFYAGLFKKMRSLNPALSSSYMIPMLQMAKGHLQYVSDVLYIVDSSSEE